MASSGVRSAGGLMSEVRLYGLEDGRIVPGEHLRSRLSLHALHGMGIREIVLGREERSGGLGSVEVAVLTIACLVFLGAFVAVLCICCIKLRRYRWSFCGKNIHSRFQPLLSVLPFF